MTDEMTDAALTALFAAPEPAPDPAFVRRIERAVRAEQALRAARRLAWGRFGGEAAATLAVTAVFASLWAFGGTAGVNFRAAGPAMAAILMLGLWFLVALQPLVEEA